MSKIYLALSCVDYEGSRVMKAFIEKCDAEDFVKVCTEYALTKVDCPVGMNDDNWDAWSKQNKIWADNHPAGADYYADDYLVQDCDLK